MDLRDWPAYPWQVDALVAAWGRRFPRYLTLDCERQYTRHRVHALTVTDTEAPADGKRAMLCYVPHAHEPAGSVACLNFVSQLLTGHHLDGAPTTLAREEVLRRAVLTVIPDANPYGRSRCPEPFWEGRRYNNREFINMVFGFGDVYSGESEKPRWERYKRVIGFSTEEAAPARIGLVYEQVSDHDYIEPGRYDERASLVKLIRRLRRQRQYDQVLSLHQTEFEGREVEDCMALPGHSPDMPPANRERLQAWAARVLGAWQAVGGRPEPLAERNDLAPGEGLHRRHFGDLRAELQRESLYMVTEVQNNSPRTPAEQQLLLDDAAIWSSIEFMI